MRDDGIAAAVEAPRRHIIERPRLTRLLDEADARILMLVAPAGYGKTTLARQWVESAGRNGCWINATPAVRDVSSFALRVRDTLNETAPEFWRPPRGIAPGRRQLEIQRRDARQTPREWVEGLGCEFMADP